jgi:hypothetical protein
MIILKQGKREDTYISRESMLVYTAQNNKSSQIMTHSMLSQIGCGILKLVSSHFYRTLFM